MGKPTNPGLTWHLLRAVLILQFMGGYLWGLDPQKSLDRYLVDQWQMSDGIASNTVLSISQTPDGYLWMGTSKGLVRFDSVKFVTLRFAKTEEIDEQEIRQLMVAKDGTLWIGSAGGLTSYQYQTGRFNTFSDEDGLSKDGIRRIKEDMKGNTWISFTSSYVSRYSRGKFTAFNASHGLLGKKINALIQDRRGNLLFGTREDGIFVYKEGTFIKYPVPGLDNLLINTMQADQSGNLWIGTNNGLFRVNREAGQGPRRSGARDGLTDDYITDILEDSEKNLWIGTNKGLNRFKRKQDGAVGFEGLLKSLTIMCLFEDREKSLWIGTDSSGVWRLKDGKFESYPPIEAQPRAIPLSLREDRNGDAWIGGFDGKLFRCRGNVLIQSLELPGLRGTGILSIGADAEGNLWLGTNGKGVFQEKNNTFRQYTTREGLADNVVTSIYRDSRDNLWFSTFDGVSVLRPGGGNIESYNSRDGLSGKVVHNVYEDKAHNIWITADKGITIISKGGWHPQPKKALRAIARLTELFAEAFRNSSGAEEILVFLARFFKPFINRVPWRSKVILPGISVTCLYEDPAAAAPGAGIYWIATNGAGLKRLSLKDGTITSYTTAQGMLSNFIYQFLEDSQGYFWLMSSSGILRAGKEELNRFASGEADRINCISFGISDGMKSLEFDNEFSRNSALKARSGELWFITKKGISIVNPGTIRFNQTPPAVVLEAVYFNRHSLPLHPGAGPVTFKGIRNLSFHFTAPTFLAPERVKFKYRLEGVDRDWIFQSPGQERAAYYQNLSPGTYTFRVSACNADGVWNQTGESMTFTIKARFYQTVMFKLLLLLLLIVLAAVFYIHKQKKHSFEKKERYGGSPLNPAFAEECITRLKYLMEIEKVYSDAGISLQSLAEKVAVAPHQLSQLLNEKLDRNFADLINGYRIEEAKRIMRSPRGARRKISAIAIEVGFNTMAAFYKAFKKHTGTTPTRFKKETGPS